MCEWGLRHSPSRLAADVPVKCYGMASKLESIQAVDCV